MKKSILYFAFVCLSITLMAQSSKPVIGIGEMKSTVGGDVNSFRAMLETAIAGTNKFELVERSRMADLISEQALSAGGITQGSGEIGGIGAVDYLIYGSITKLGVESNNMDLGKFSSNSQTAVMAVDLRVVDAATGSIRISETVETEASISSGLNIDGRSLGGGEADPLGSVQRLAANNIATKIAMNVFPIKVINVAKGQIYLNYGDSLFSKCSFGNSDNCFVKIVSLGDGFIDPDTGEMLGAEETYIGAAEVVDPKDKFTIANILEGEINRGDQAYIISGKDGKKIKKRVEKARKDAKRKAKKKKKKKKNK
jgi:hypothetical protein